MSVRASLTVAVVVGTVFVVGCAQTSSSPTSPSSSASSAVPNGGALNPAVSSGLTASALGRAVTDETLANAGWTCIQPGNGLTLCFPPGLGAPPFKPVVGAPTYTFMSFTPDHQFVHRVTLRRADLYHGQPCLGGAAWDYLGNINLDYFECINPA